MMCLETLIESEAFPTAVVKVCTLREGHDGSHEADGWKWA